MLLKVYQYSDFKIISDNGASLQKYKVVECKWRLLFHFLATQIQKNHTETILIIIIFGQYFKHISSQLLHFKLTAFH